MRFRKDNKFSKITLGESYNNNYKVLFENSGNKNGMYLFNGIPVFKYKKLIIKYDKMPTENEIKFEIQNFMDKISSEGKFKVFSIKGNKVKKNKNVNEYVINVAFITFN